jgi:hypothetical protein
MTDKKSKTVYEEITKFLPHGLKINKHHPVFGLLQFLCQLMDDQNKRIDSLEKWVESKRGCGL